MSGGDNANSKNGGFYRERGTGGISKSQHIPTNNIRTPSQQHLTSQQIYQQNYYYMRKYERQKRSLEEELSNIHLSPEQRENKEGQLRKLQE
jgi:hypothetical protein